MLLRHTVTAALLALVAAPFAVACSSSDEETSATPSPSGTSQTGTDGGANPPPTATTTTPTTPPPSEPTPAEKHAAEQAAANAIVVGQQARAAAFFDGATSDGIATFVIGRDDLFPAIFHIAQSAVTTVEGGFAAKGDLTLETPLGPLTFFKAEVIFAKGSDGKIETLSGTVEIPPPALGALEGFKVDAPIRGTIGYDTGRHLNDRVEAPLLDDRKYIVFDYSAALSAKVGDVTFSMAGGKGGTFVLDPADPSFYVTGSFLGYDQLGPLEDVAVGLSARGLLPFVPENTYGVVDKAKPFTGHLFAKGAVSFKKIPVKLDGEVVVNVDPTGVGRVFGSGAPEGLQIGANGKANVVFDAAFYKMTIPFAKSTVGGQVSNKYWNIYTSGEVGPDADWLPSILPFVPQAKAQTAVYLEADPTKARLSATADFVFRANKYYAFAPGLDKLGLKDVPVVKATLAADFNGLRIKGDVVSPNIPILKPKGSLQAEAFVPANNPMAFNFTMRGAMSLGDFPLESDAFANINQVGFVARGTFKTPLAQISMFANMNNENAAIQGQVKIPLTGLARVVETITEAGKCGYKKARSASLCGYEKVKDGAECGYTTVKSVAQCGESTVTSAALCGSDYVTDGTKCGYDTVSTCFLSGFSNCKTAKSCNIARTCKVANECDIENECQIAAECDQPIPSCDVQKDDPTANFGELVGTLNISVVNGRSSGYVSGKVCKGTSCTDIAKARVILGNNPQACVTGLPGLVGEICAKF